MSFKQDNILSMGPRQQLDVLERQKAALNTANDAFRAGKVLVAKATFSRVDFGAITILSARGLSREIREKAAELKRRAATAARKLPATKESSSRSTEYKEEQFGPGLF